jgi:hypothetical protein
LVSGGSPEQLRLDERPDRWSGADRAVDELRSRYGDDAVERAAVSEQRPRIHRADEDEQGRTQ